MDYYKELRRAKDKNEFEKIFEAIYNDYFKLIFFIINSIVNDVEDSKDLTQDTFINLFNQLGKSNIRNIKAYLITTAKHIAIAFIKKNSMVYNDLEFIDRIADSKSIYYNSILENFKKYLTEEEFTIVIEHIVYDIKLIDIAKHQGKSPNTIKSIYRRALVKLRDKMKV